MAAPGPEMDKSLFTASCALVRVMTPETENVIVSPGTAAEMASRREPGPASEVVVTTPARQGKDNITAAESGRSTKAPFIWAKWLSRLGFIVSCFHQRPYRQNHARPATLPPAAPRPNPIERKQLSHYTNDLRRVLVSKADLRMARPHFANPGVPTCRVNGQCRRRSLDAQLRV